MYTSFIGIWMVINKWYEKHDPYAKKALTVKNVRLLSVQILSGLMIGTGLNTVCVMAATLRGDITLIYSSFQPLKLIAVFIAVFIQSSAEELLCRNFIYAKLRHSYKNPLVAIIANSIFFAALHLLNPGAGMMPIIYVFIAGIFFTLIVYYTGGIYCVMAAHAAWNYTQNIIFGLPNSGFTAQFSIFKLDAASARSSATYNTGFGVEGTWFAVILMLASCLAVFRIYSRKEKELSNNGKLSGQHQP